MCCDVPQPFPLVPDSAQKHPSTGPAYSPGLDPLSVEATQEKETRLVLFNQAGRIVGK